MVESWIEFAFKTFFVDIYPYVFDSESNENVMNKKYFDHWKTVKEHFLPPLSILTE